MYIICLKVEIFASDCKVSRLVLISKEKDPPDAASSYTPLCWMNTAEHGVMEKLIKPR